MQNNNMDVRVLWVFSGQYLQEWGIKQHRHDFYHIYYIYQNDLVFYINGVETPVREGQIVFIKKGVLHGTKKLENDVAKFYEIKFIVFNSRLEDLLSPISPVFDSDEFSSSIIRQIIAESMDLKPFFEQSIYNCFMALIYYISKSCRIKNENESRLIDTMGFSPITKSIVKYLEEEYMHEVTLQAIADNVGLNKNYICHVFKKDSRLTIIDCLNIIRIRKAAEMISYSDMSLAQISRATGFSNLNHFSRVFKQITGIPPGHYRRMFPLDVVIPGQISFPKGFNIEESFVIPVLAGRKISMEKVLKAPEAPDPDESSSHHMDSEKNAPAPN